VCNLPEPRRFGCDRHYNIQLIFLTAMAAIPEVCLDGEPQRRVFRFPGGPENELRVDKTFSSDLLLFVRLGVVFCAHVFRANGDNLTAG
jgi:hypothetical protein